MRPTPEDARQMITHYVYIMKIFFCLDSLCKITTTTTMSTTITITTITTTISTSITTTIIIIMIVLTCTSGLLDPCPRSYLPPWTLSTYPGLISYLMIFNLYWFDIIHYCFQFTLVFILVYHFQLTLV